MSTLVYVVVALIIMETQTSIGMEQVVLLETRTRLLIKVIAKTLITITTLMDTGEITITEMEHGLMVTALTVLAKL